ncbi:MAG: DUF4178 domain-containing protein [Acidobacteria bacterium]|nr:DUF4178 domain-containing protein [Acidobacteriota bacterium]
MSRFATRCPNCGGPIAFAWAQSVQTVCSHCTSLVVRHDVNVEVLGKVASVPPDVSPIQIGTRGRFDDGGAFEVVGRIVYEYEDGGWNEWYVAFDSGASGWLSDAQAEYAISRPVEPGAALPAAEAVAAGTQVRVAGHAYVATTVTKARYVAVEGELPFVTWDREWATFADLKTTTGHFATIDYTEDPPLCFAGRFAEFDELSFTNLRDPASLLSERAVRGFNCSACASAIALRAGQHTATVACPSCGTIVSPRDPNLRVVQDAAVRMSHVPTIPLGSRGTLDGDAWDVIGFQYRTITVEGEHYGWDEYLLLNPRKGFRYLSEYQGHWNLIRPLRAIPDGDRVSSADLYGQSFTRFQGAQATTRVVYGEFPWQVRAGDVVETVDFVAPPLLLSHERAGDDDTWSVGMYTPGDAIWKAFALPGEPPPAIGVFANQPSPHAGRPRVYWRMFGLLAILWLAFIGARCGLAGNRVVFKTDAAFTRVPPETSTAFVTEEFDIPGSMANVEVEARATSLTNDWLSLPMALVNVDTGTAIDFGAELSFYSGVEDGEAWAEDQRTTRVTLPSVPGGRYLLRVEPTGGQSGQRIAYGLAVRRDVPRLGLVLLAFALLAIPPVFVSMSAAGFERRRWAESGEADAGDDSDDASDEESSDDESSDDED